MIPWILCSVTHSVELLGPTKSPVFKLGPTTTPHFSNRFDASALHHSCRSSPLFIGFLQLLFFSITCRPLHLISNLQKYERLPCLVFRRLYILIMVHNIPSICLYMSLVFLWKNAFRQLASIWFEIWEVVDPCKKIDFSRQIPNKFQYFTRQIFKKIRFSIKSFRF